MNDFGCRFVGGDGSPGARPDSEACVLDPDTGQEHFVDPSSTVEFCTLPIPFPIPFPKGDTLLSVRLRDIHNNVGPVSQIVVHIDS
jgi:hypothetical protein